MTKTELLKIAKPILFNTKMVKAILDGRKTVTRRVVKTKAVNLYLSEGGLSGFFKVKPLGDQVNLIKPKYNKGDILYVRETYYRTYHHQYGKNFYRADGEEIQMPTICGDTVTYGKANGLKWKPSIHMPKSAARIFLKVTDVRVEKLQDITVEQAIKEGFGGTPCGCSTTGCTDCHDFGWREPPQVGFMHTWDSTIKKQDLDEYGWNANPWVWVYEFEREEINND